MGELLASGGAGEGAGEGAEGEEAGEVGGDRRARKKREEVGVGLRPPVCVSMFVLY